MQKWIEEARKEIGVARLPVGDQPRILEYLEHNSNIPGVEKAWWKNQKESWCGTFAGYCLAKTGYKIPKDWYRAQSYLSKDVGTILDKPAMGSIVIFKRKGGGHVGFVVGKRADGKLLVLGGNQSSAVNIMAKGTDDVLGFVYPARTDGVKETIDYNLPVSDAPNMGSTE